MSKPDAPLGNARMGLLRLTHECEPGGKQKSKGRGFRLLKRYYFQSGIYRIFVETTKDMELRMPVSFDQVLELVSRLELTKKQRIQLVEAIQKETKTEAKPLTAQQKGFVDDMKQALHEVELHQQGKIGLQSAEDFMQAFEVEHREYWRKKDKRQMTAKK